MKIATVTHVSVDGVMQGLGGSDEDPRGGFEHGGWALRLFEGEAAALLELIESRTLDGHTQELIYRPTLHL